MRYVLFKRLFYLVVVQTSRFSETKLPIWCLNLRSSIVINRIDIEVY